MVMIMLKNVTKCYIKGVLVVKSFNFDIVDREFVVFFGLLGCGKMIVLWMIVGLEDIMEG